MDEKIGNLKPGMENISVTVRVLKAEEQKVISTRNGERTISEAIVGDDTGRTKLTLWGEQAGKLQEGAVVKIDNAWTSAFKGQVQLNAGNRSKITEASDSEVPEEASIPETVPSAPEDYRPPRRNFYRGGRGQRYGEQRGGYRQRSYESNDYSSGDDE